MPRGDAARDVVEPAHARPPSAWPAVEADLRHALAVRGHRPLAIDRVLADLRPVYVAVERARVSVEPELVLALLSVAADRARRGVLNQRSRERVEAEAS